ncbi:MAG: hypothetical protein N2C14_04090 [Planctomycetales bacterium]
MCCENLVRFLRGGSFMLAATGAALLWTGAQNVAPAEDVDSLPTVYQEDFENGAEQWEPSDPKAWKVLEVKGGNKVFNQFKKRSDYKPPHRSPYNMALLKDVHVEEFVLDVKAQSTHPDYNHRDMCLFFGYQDPAHFYYVHLGKKTDAHANQIFIVNDAPRTKISLKTTPGPNWDDQWHHVRIVRQPQDGTIQIFYDDMKNPIMEAKDKTFTWGRVGLGSFDDTGSWDEFTLRGEKIKKPVSKKQ